MLHANSDAIILRFTANHTCSFAQLDSIFVENLTQGGSMMLYYPDTVLVLLITSIDMIETGINELYVSQNYPNPFSSETHIDVYVPDEDFFVFDVYDLMGRKILGKSIRLAPGMHSFTFKACNQHNYILSVTSGKSKRQRLMIQSASHLSTTAKIIYNGVSQKLMPGIKAATYDFPFELGDELQFTGYAGNDYEIITDQPEYDKDYLFDIANAVPDKPSDITGNTEVYANESGLTYEVEQIEGLIYNWTVPSGWTITSGQGTHSITVDAGIEQGNISVTAGNDCGDSQESTLQVSVYFILTLEVNPVGWGEATGGGDYREGNEVILTAIANEGYGFITWTNQENQVVSTEAEFVYTMPAEDVTLTANFELVYNLVLVANPEESGVVNGSGTYHFGNEVTLTAIDNEGYGFITWTDQENQVVSTDAEFVYTMPAEDVTLTANFELVDYNLVLVANPEEGGAVNGSGTYHFGNEVILTAIANEGYGFITWTDQENQVVSTEAEFIYTMPAEDITLTANFGLVYNLVLVANPEGVGVVIGSGTYHFGNEVILTAIANEGYGFINWTDQENQVVSTEAEFVYTMPAADVTLTANFGLVYNLVLVANPEGGGVVNGSGTYHFGNEVTLTAIANEGYGFIDWTDQENQVVSTEAEFVYTMPAEDVTLTANFELVDYNLVLVANPEEGGVVNGSGTYHFGHEVILTAIANEGYEFMTWTDQAGYAVSTEAEFTFTMPAADVTLIANFAIAGEKDFWIKLKVPTGGRVFSFETKGKNEIYAGMGNGVYLSNDNSITWSHIGLEDITVYSLHIHQNGNIFAGTGGFNALYRMESIEEGWVPILPSLSNNIVSIMHTYSGDLHFGFWGGIYKSIDNGDTWAQTLVLSYTQLVRSIIENNNGTMFAGATDFMGGGGVYRSMDNGNTWQHVGLLNKYIRSLAVNSQNVLFAGSVGDHYQYYGGLYKSTDNGETWVELRNDVLVTSIVITPNDHIYFGSNEYGDKAGVFFSNDNGETWERIISGLIGFSNQKIEGLGLAPDGYLYAYGNHLHRSLEPVFLIKESK